MKMPKAAELPIYLRAHTIRVRQDTSRSQRRGAFHERPSKYALLISCPSPLPDGCSKLLGAFHVMRDNSFLHGGLICADATSDADLAASLQALRAQSKQGRGSSKRLAVLRRQDFVKKVLVPSAFDLKATIIGFDLPVDLSNLAVSWPVARSEPYAGGFSLSLREYKDKHGKRRSDSYTPRIAVKGIDGHRGFIGFTSNRREQRSGNPRKSRNKPRPSRGKFLDCRTLAFAVAGKDLDLDEACGTFGVAHDASPREGNSLTKAIEAHIKRLANVGALYHSLAGICTRVSSGMPLEHIYSGAGVGKLLLRRAGVQVPRTRVDPAVGVSPDQVDGWAMASTYAGRSECRVRGVIVPVAYCDFRSMYPTVCTLMGVWGLLLSEKVVVEDTTKAAERVLNIVTAQDLLSPIAWKDKLVLVEIETDEDILPSRCKYGKSGNRCHPSLSTTLRAPFRWSTPWLIASPRRFSLESLPRSAARSGSVRWAGRCFGPFRFAGFPRWIHPVRTSSAGWSRPATW